MFGVAGLAGMRIILQQDPVHGSRITLFLFNIHMAIQAQVRHGLSRPKGHMALTTILANACVRGHRTQARTSLRIERSRVEHGIA